MLGERIQNAYEWSGIALVVAAITYYLYIQYRQSQKLAAAAAAVSADDELSAALGAGEAEAAEMKALVEESDLESNRSR